jgi:hypothetical protein
MPRTKALSEVEQPTVAGSRIVLRDPTREYKRKLLALRQVEENIPSSEADMLRLLIDRAYEQLEE